MNTAVSFPGIDCGPNFHVLTVPSRERNTSAIAQWHVSVNRYSAMLIPACPGAVHDLANNSDLGQLIAHFVAEKSR